MQSYASKYFRYESYALYLNLREVNRRDFNTESTPKTRFVMRMSEKFKMGFHNYSLGAGIGGGIPLGARASVSATGYLTIIKP